MSIKITQITFGIFKHWFLNVCICLTTELLLCKTQCWPMDLTLRTTSLESHIRLVGQRVNMEAPEGLCHLTHTSRIRQGASFPHSLFRGESCLTLCWQGENFNSRLSVNLHFFESVRKSVNQIISPVWIYILYPFFSYWIVGHFLLNS